MSDRAGNGFWSGFKFGLGFFTVATLAAGLLAGIVTSTQAGAAIVARTLDAVQKERITTPLWTTPAGSAPRDEAFQAVLDHQRIPKESRGADWTQKDAELWRAYREHSK